MSSVRKQIHITQPLINSLDPQILPRLEPSYIEYYNKYKAGRLATHQVPIEKLRANYLKYVIVVGKMLGPEVHGVSHNRIPVEDHTTISVRIFEPKPTAQPRPAYINYHGGGWVFGDHSADDDFCRRVVDSVGCVVFDIDYRLAPEHPFPTPVDDSIKAFKWVIAHAHDYNLDVNRVAVGGYSAGGHIAAVIAHVCRDEGIPLALQLLGVPSVDITSAFTHEGELAEDCPYASYRENRYNPELSLERMQFFHKHFLGNPRPSTYDNDWKISPLRASNFNGLAPALVVTAEIDTLRDEGEEYARKMNKNGSKAEAVRLNAVHPFLHLDEIVAAGMEYHGLVADALKKAFNTV